MTRMLSTDEARALVGVSRVTLRQAMLATPEHIHRPWSCYGGQGASVRYRWDGASCELGGHPCAPEHNRHDLVIFPLRVKMPVL